MHANSRPILDRFLNKIVINKQTGCWVWTANTLKTRGGYGVIYYMGKNWRAHRVSWLLFKGEHPGELMVCHRCDNPPCVNPEHLFLGSQSDNERDKVAKKRHAWVKRSCCSRGHKYTKSNTRWYRGHRQCRKCFKLYATKEWKERNNVRV